MKTLLNAAEIAARVPHSGTMCLLRALHESSDTHVLCSTTSHREADNPLRSASGLLSCNAIEYAAQAMALHGAMAAAADAPPQGGRLASVASSCTRHDSTLSTAACSCTPSALLAMRVKRFTSSRCAMNNDKHWRKAAPQCY
jgi:predicted hotdog family 3-hydroxylacyl-ACP dehydratase